MSRPADDLKHPGGVGAPKTHRSWLGVLCVTALGIVYGDIGTSPLYALRECFHGEHGVPVNPGNVLGVLSLIFWSLLVVVTLKYHVYVLHFDNRGEGGILALMGLIRPGRRKRASARWTLITLGVFGAALLYGDGMITPAISVLSAVEGLEVGTRMFEPFVVPITVVILVGLFLFQRRGTFGIGAIFGPVMVVWFATIAVLGLASVLREPSVLGAVNPAHAVRFFAENGGRGFLVLGAVFLVATGGEALYADLGHFGERPIQIDWFLLVGPSLLLNYFGQGALLIRDPTAVQNPFYRLGPAWALYPLIVLATLATIIASQAIISGAFSLTRQAVQLGYLPRVRIVHTSSSEIGQIYIPAVNWTLMLATIGLVLGFQRSSNLAAAYGVAVTTTMVITTILAGVVSREVFGWSTPVSILVTAGFLLVDLVFFAANAIKIEHGGWFPLLVAAVVFTLMTSWREGRRLLNRSLRESLVSVKKLLEGLGTRGPTRVPGTAIYFSMIPDVTPPALVNNLKFNKVLHERVILLTVITEEIPQFPAEERVIVEPLGANFYGVLLHYGYMEDPNVPEALAALRKSGRGLDLDDGKAAYFLGKEGIIPTRRKKGMAFWREKLFAWMSQNATSAMTFYCLPPDRTIELRGQIEI
jgi:KUP system potassium uptake protein